MSLASLVDKPLMQNPLAGGGAPQIIDPSVITPRGGMFNATPPSVPLSEQTPLPGIIGDPLRPRSDDPLMQGFFDSEFYNPRSTTNVVNYKFRGKDMQGSGSQASDLKKYLESIGQGNLIELSNESIAQQGSGPLATMPTQEEGIPRLSGSNVPLSGDQGLMDRLTSLEQGIGSLQNQIASLFQMGQASDPFGLGGFINQRRF